MTKYLPEIPNRIEWQIDRRRRIQKIMFKQKKFLERYKEFPEPETGRFWMQMCWMTDAAFSLWRAAFLTNTQKDKKVVYTDMKELLNKVIEHNSITFADDHRMRSWSWAYYNANARYRIQRIIKWNKEPLKELRTVREFKRLRKKGYLGLEDPCKLWDVSYIALNEIYKWFEFEWRDKMRPKKMQNDPFSKIST